MEGEQSKYDILNNNWMSSYLDIDYDTEKKIVEKDNFYKKAIEWYLANTKSFE